MQNESSERHKKINDILPDHEEDNQVIRTTGCSQFTTIIHVEEKTANPLLDVSSRGDK